jgi:hypothetical protein
MLLAIPFACTPADTDDTDVPVDTDTGGEIEPVTFVTVAWFDFSNGAPLVGVDVTDGTDHWTSDAYGESTVPVPWDADFELIATIDGYPDGHLFGHAAQRRFAGFSFGMASYGFRDALVTAVGEQADDTAGLVAISVLGPNGLGVVGASIDLAAPYDLAVVADPASQIGLSPGNELVDPGGSFAVFVNVAPGPATPILGVPDGYTCTASPGDDASLALTVYADAVTQMVFECTGAPP